MDLLRDVQGSCVKTPVGYRERFGRSEAYIESGDVGF